MGLTLPGVLGRVFTAAANLFQTSQVAGESFPSYLVEGGGIVRASDGSEDLTVSLGVSTFPPNWYMRRRSGNQGLVIRGNNDGSLKSLLEIHDYLGFPILVTTEAGAALAANDNVKILYNMVNGPVNWFGDIYGHMQLGALSAMRCTTGPPGNIMTFVDSIGEIFQRSRGGNQGSWTATNATYSVPAALNGFSPAGLSFTRKWTAVATANMVMQTGIYPCISGQYVTAMIKTQPLATGRAKTLSLVWFKSDGVTSAGADTSGTAVTDAPGLAWYNIYASGAAPAGAV